MPVLSDQQLRLVFKVSVVLALFLWAPAAAQMSMAEPPNRTAPIDQVTIGVISSHNTPTGTGHEDTIRLAFQRAGEVIPIGDRQVRLAVRYEDDGGDPAVAVQKARELAEDGRVAAILGPVSSDASKAVVQAGLRVPIISPLSTSPVLTDQRDPWFFRATLNDRDRMAQYARFVTQDLKISSGPYLLLCHTGEYGTGLCNGLTDRLGDAVVRRTWDEILVPGTVAESDRGHASEQFVPDLAPLVSRASSIFVLGPSAGAVNIARGIVEAYDPPGREPFFFVGSDTRLLLDAPEGSYTCGEPTSDLDNSAVNADARKQLDEILAAFRASSPHPENFILTAFEVATFVVPAAIAQAVQQSGDTPDVEALRDKLRQVLEERTFDSSTPARKLAFRQGSLTNPPPAPIVGVRRTFVREDQVGTRPWVDLDIRGPFRYFEGPISIPTHGHALGEGRRIKIEAVREGDNVITGSWDIPASGEATLRFHPIWPGKFRFQANVPLAPAEPEVELNLSPDYPLSVFGAFLGSLLASLIAGYDARKEVRRRIVTGLLTGILVTLFYHYRTYVPAGEVIPLPRLESTPEANAIFTGFLGGWLGLNALGLLSRIPFLSSGTPPPEPVVSPNTRPVG